MEMESRADRECRRFFAQKLINTESPWGIGFRLAFLLTLDPLSVENGKMNQGLSGCGHLAVALTGFSRVRRYQSNPE